MTAFCKVTEMSTFEVLMVHFLKRVVSSIIFNTLPVARALQSPSIPSILSLKLDVRATYYRGEVQVEGFQYLELQFFCKGREWRMLVWPDSPLMSSFCCLEHV